jgi:hypothetical protein
MNTLILRLQVIIACLGLAACSVSMPDAAYLDAARDGFPEINYPANKISGDWFRFSSGTLGYRGSGGREDRAEFQFRPGGSGTIREITQFHGADGRMDSDDHFIALSAPIRWSHLSANMWRVYVPDSSHFRVERTNGPSISGTQKAHSFRIRYKNGRLYDIDNTRTLIPKSQAKDYIDRERARIRRGEVMPIVIGI